MSADDYAHIRPVLHRGYLETIRLLHERACAADMREQGLLPCVCLSMGSDNCYPTSVNDECLTVINRLEPRKSAKSATRDLQIIFASGIASRDASRDEDYTLIRRDQGCAICSRLEARTEMAGRCAGSGSTIRGSYQGPSTKLRGGIAADTKLIIRTAQQGR